jgi:hypothetical protein
MLAGEGFPDKHVGDALHVLEQQSSTIKLALLHEHCGLPFGLPDRPGWKGIVRTANEQ